MSDWSFIDKFGKGVAKRNGTTTRSFWLAAMTGPASAASTKGKKDSFTEEDMHGFSERLKNWIREHPNEVMKLLGCIAVPSIAVSFTPMALGMVGFGPLGVIAGAPAASVQAALGPIAAGGAFAVLQSAGMGGYGIVIVKMIAAGGGFLGTCPAAAMSFLKAMEEEKCKRGDDKKTDVSCT